MSTIQELKEENLQSFLDLLLELARHHNQERFVLTNIKKLREGLKESRFQAIMAYDDHNPIGYASYTWNYSIWTGELYMNLDDLFVHENYRGQKIGQALMAQLQKIGSEQGVDYIRWEVEATNQKAIRFYENLGATMKSKGIFKWEV